MEVLFWVLVAISICQKGDARFSTENPIKPHIIHILIDDLGWADVGYHRKNSGDVSNKTDVETPNIDALVDSGIDLQRFYTHKFCSPSRCAIQSGRHPIHVNVQNVPPEVRNSKDSQGGYQVIYIYDV